MFNKKLTYFRKKNMLSQEKLAEKICVSRQTITKWESGVTFPTLEYLIDLSNVFGITIDHLIRDDDCTSDTNVMINNNKLVSFLVDAKKETYASKKNKINSTREGSHDYHYCDDDYCYYDSFFGASFFSGQEVVYKDNQVCWTMNYYGQALSDDFNGDFLKESLMMVDEQRPLRGPEIYHKGEYTYISTVCGELTSFHGHEVIYYQTQKIYDGLFHGGIIK